MKSREATNYPPFSRFIKLIYRDIDKNKVVSDSSVRALKIIRYCAIIISALYLVGMPYIFQVADKDDAPGVVALGLLFAFIPMVIAASVTIIQSVLQDVLKNYVRKI